MSQIGGEAEMAVAKVAADKAAEEQRLRELREEDDDFDWTGGSGGVYPRGGDDDDTSQTSNDDTVSTGMASGHMTGPVPYRVSTAQSVGSASTYTFCEDDFLLPELDALDIGKDLASIHLHKKLLAKEAAIKLEMKKEKHFFRDLDAMNNAPDIAFGTPGLCESTATLKARRLKCETDTELGLIQHVINRKPGEYRDHYEAIRTATLQASQGTYEEEESSVDNPKLDSVHEKLADLKQEEVERWCLSRGLKYAQRYTNKDKRMLRQWFKELDTDGSGEVNVEELQDPLISAGILKTKAQVVRVLANVDKNNTMGIDFEEFLSALHSNKLADNNKLDKLQKMSSNPFGFSMETLITALRRQKLAKSIITGTSRRAQEVEAHYRKYDKPRLSRGERERMELEQEALDEKQKKSLYLHSKYIDALVGVIQGKKEALKEEQTKKTMEYTQAKMDSGLMRAPGRPPSMMSRLSTRDARHITGTGNNNNINNDNNSSLMRYTAGIAGHADNSHSQFHRGSGGGSGSLAPLGSGGGSTEFNNNNNSIDNVSYTMHFTDSMTSLEKFNSIKPVTKMSALDEYRKNPYCLYAAAGPKAPPAFAKTTSPIIYQSPARGKRK